jgi:predicted secreted hydrolase
MAVSGTLTQGTTARQVTGTGWMDHQWGTFDVFQSNGWDWYSIQLGDGTDLMFYFIHFKDGHTALTGGTLVNAAGCYRPVGEVDITATGSWTSADTKATYPQGWIVQVPAEALSLTISTEVPDQEMDTIQSTDNTYWEGAVDVTGTHHGAPVDGQGYVELAGYGPWGPPQ